MSQAETLLAVQLEQAGIAFEREYRFAAPRRWRADFAVFPRPVYEGERWIHQRILIEVDGGGFIAGRHSRGLGMEHDCEKASAAAIRGYRVIRVTPAQVNDGRALSWIRQALRFVGVEHGVVAVSVVREDGVVAPQPHADRVGLSSTGGSHD